MRIGDAVQAPADVVVCQRVAVACHVRLDRRGAQKLVVVEELVREVGAADVVDQAELADVPVTSTASPSGRSACESRPSGTVANPADELDAIARAGGVPVNPDPAERSYYEAAEGEELLEALEEISARLECTVTLPEAATDEAIMRVVVAGRHVSQVDDCRTDSGWVFSDAGARKTIELCNDACDGLRAWGQIEPGACFPGA